MGKAVLELSFHYLRANALVEAASPVLIELQRTTGERVNLIGQGTKPLARYLLIFAPRSEGKRDSELLMLRHEASRLGSR